MGSNERIIVQARRDIKENALEYPPYVAYILHNS